MACSPLTPPRIVAVATDHYLTPTYASSDKGLPGPAPKYGQDFTFGVGRKAPKGHDVGSTEAVLKPKMQKLLGIFAKDDTSGMAKRLFDKFLAKQTSIYYFDDSDLTKAAAAHSNVKYFIDAALGASIAPPPGKKRIHQALQAAGWDINKLVAPTDLGVPAFNEGDKKFSQTGDFANGLGLMINGVQHVYVVATHYQYDAAKKQYCIQLEFRFYDVFGLDDDDLDEYGEKSDGSGAFTRGALAIGGGIAGMVAASKLATLHEAGVGITAWWQLQHQHGYAPLVTRIIIPKAYTVTLP